MSYQGPGPVGNGSVKVPQGGSLDSGLKAKEGKHNQRDVKVNDDVVPFVGSKAGNPPPAPNKPLPERKLTDRDVIPNGELDPLGLSGGSLGDQELEALLDEQLDQQRPPGDKPGPKPGSLSTPGEDDQPPVPHDGDSLDQPLVNSSKTGHQPKVKISSTTEAEEQENIDGIKKGLKSRLGFLDKIPHKKNLLFIAIGTALCAASLAAMPATLGLLGLGSALILTGTAYMLHDAGSSGNEGAQPTPPAEKKKDEDEEKTKTDESSSSSTTPETPDDGFLAVANPEFQEAKQSTDAEEARKKLQELFKQKPPFPPQQLDDLVTSLASGKLPLSHAVAEITGELLHKAGMDHKDKKAWAYLDQMINAIEGGLADDTSGEENAKKMQEACLGVLNAMSELTPQILLDMRGQTVALLSSNAVNAACKQVLEAQLEAIDMKLSEMKGKASATLEIPTPTDAGSGMDPDGKLGLDSEILEGTHQRRHYLAFRMELAGQIENNNINLSEFEADRVLFAAMNILQADPHGTLSGSAFLQRLKQEPSMAPYAKEIQKVAQNRLFSDGTTP